MVKNNIKKLKFQKSGNISKSPYILEIPKFKTNESLLDSGEGLKFNSEISPISNSELEYNPDLYNNNYNIKASHNCYSYAMGKIVPGLDSKAQPGYASGFNHVSSNDFKCKSFRKRLKKDSPGSYLEKFDNSCIPGFYKVFLALDPPNDYHWWRQDLDTYWSHKPGSSDVVNLDASGKKIKNPLISDRNFKHRNYYEPCFFACIYSDLSRSIDTIYSNNF
jgi:hypothetical protein